MKKFYLISLLITVISACRSEQEVPKERLTEAILEFYEDEIFKQNAKSTLLEIKDLSYRKVSKNYLDTLQLYDNLKHIDKCLKYQAEFFKLKDSFVKLNDKVMAEKNFEYGRSMIDSMNHLKAMNLLIQHRLRNQKNMPLDFFEVTFTIKTIVNGENFLSTDRVVIVDKNYRASLPFKYLLD